jgi:hypothetical protein
MTEGMAARDESVRSKSNEKHSIDFIGCGIFWVVV